MSFKHSSWSFLLFVSLLTIVRIPASLETTPSPSPASTSPSPPSTSPAPATGPLDPEKAAIEVQQIFDIIKGSGSNKAADLFEIYATYPNCADRIAIETSYRESQFNFDKKGDNSGSDENSLSDEDKERARLTIATFLFGCDTALSYSYHLKVLCDKKEEGIRGITGILVACSVNEEFHSALQKNFDDRFAHDDDKIKEIIEEAVGNVDTKSVCHELLEKKRKTSKDKPDDKKAKEIADSLVTEEKETEGWSNKRDGLDDALMSLPLQESQLVVEKFSKDGKGLKEVIQADFSDDVDKMNVYVQLIDLVQFNNFTLLGNELKFGLDEAKDALYPMRIFTAINKKADLTEIETAFQKENKGVQLREKIKEITLSSNLDYAAKFFQDVLDEEWGTTKKSDLTSESAPSPATSSPSTKTTPPAETPSPSPPPTPPPPTKSTSPSPPPTSPSPPPSPSPPSPSPPPPSPSPPSPSPPPP